MAEGEEKEGLAELSDSSPGSSHPSLFSHLGRQQQVLGQAPSHSFPSISPFPYLGRQQVLVLYAQHLADLEGSTSHPEGGENGTGILYL